jgi:diguanylate cyclase
LRSRNIPPDLVTLAHSLELDVVAEGVEMSVQHNLLSAMGCDHLQGYLFSKPVPPDDLVRLVRANRSQRAPRKSLIIAPA